MLNNGEYSSKLSNYAIDLVPTTNKKYRKVMGLPQDDHIENARSTFSNGILKIGFDKKKKTNQREKKLE